MNERVAKAVDFVRKHGAGIAREALVNFIGPILIYDYTHHQLGDAHALMVAAAPPIAWSVIEFVRHRRVDAVSIFVILGIVLSLLAYLGGGSAKFLQLREDLVGALVGLIFLGSAAIGKPLFYQLAHASMMRRSADEAAAFAARRDLPGFRRTMTVITFVWGLALMVQTAIACVLVFSLSVHDYLWAGKVVGYGFLGLMIGWTVLYIRRRRRLAAAAEAAASSQTETGPTAT